MQQQIQIEERRSAVPTHELFTRAVVVVATAGLLGLGWYLWVRWGIFVVESWYQGGSLFICS